MGDTVVQENTPFVSTIISSLYCIRVIMYLSIFIYNVNYAFKRIHVLYT